MDGRLLTYKWDEFIESLCVEKELRLALECGFCRGDYLYNPNFELLFSDHEIVKVLKLKFEELSKRTFEFQIKDLDKYLYGEQENPLKTLCADSDIYNNHLYVATDFGLWQTSVHRRSKKYPVSSKPEKVWDGRLLSLKSSSNGRLALSAGDDGLFEFDINDRSYFKNTYLNVEFKKIERNLFQLNKRHSFLSNWNYSSIYSTSNVDESYMMLFGWGKNEMKEMELVYKKLLNESELFQLSGNTNRSQLSWGCDNKIYKTSISGGIDVIDYTQKYVLEEDTPAFTDIQHIALQPWKGDVVSGGVAYFGVIIECENALVVMQDDNDFFNIPDVATRWRTYPRSRRYENHLHVISEDRLDVYSFNHDYFRSQEGKKIGIRYREKIQYNQGYRK